MGNTGLRSGKVSLKVMPFLTSKCSHIKNITRRPEDIEKTMMASKSTEDAMVLKINDGNYIHIEGYKKERVGERYATTLDCIFQSVQGQDIKTFAKI